jgi:hypothetical protein
MFVLRQKLICALRTPGAAVIVRKVSWLVVCPTLKQRRIERPSYFDSFTVREQRGIAEHRVEQQALVAIGRVLTKCVRILELGLHWADGSVGRRQLVPEGKRDALFRLDTNTDQVDHLKRP